jgi:hypothetical protein
MSTPRVIASFAAIGLVSLGVLGFAAWKLHPEALPAPALGKRTSAGHAAGNMAAVSGPHLPPEKPCLAAPTDAAEDEMAASAGLDPDAVRAVMRTAVQGTLHCFEGSPSVTLMLAINVACTGRVSKVEVEEDGGASAEVQQCVQNSLRYAAFPAHALPDGDTFEYPLSYDPPSPT